MFSSYLINHLDVRIITHKPRRHYKTLWWDPPRPYSDVVGHVAPRLGRLRQGAISVVC